MNRNPFDEIIPESSTDLWQYMEIQTQKAFRTPNGHDQKRITLHHITVKVSRLQRKEIMFNVAREKHQLTYKRNLIKVTSTSCRNAKNWGSVE
jgi:hypothetical protein